MSLNRYFQDELTYLREMLDDELPEVAHSLVELVWPNYLRPVPAMTVIEFTPIPGADLSAPIPRGTMVDSQPVSGTTCRFQTCYDIRCVPLRVTDVTTESTPTSSRLTVQFGVLEGTDLAQVGVQRLRLFLDAGADLGVARDLYRALMQDVRSIEFVGGEGTSVSLAASALAPVGFTAEEAVLPYPPNAFPGFRLLQEYFAFPEKFMFVDLDVGNRLRGLRGRNIELRIAFSRPLNRGTSVTPGSVRLNCTPAVNVFPDDGEPITVDRRKSEYRVRPMSANARQIEVYGVERVVGWVRGRNAQIDYKPFAAYRPIAGSGNGDVYFRIRRRSGVASQAVDSYVSFVDSENRSAAMSAETVSVDLTCTNGRAPESLTIGMIDQPTASTPTFATFRNPARVTPQTPPPIDRNLLWILISNLALNYSTLADPKALGTILATYNVRAQVDEQERRRMELMLEGIRRVTVEPLDWVRRGVPLRGVRYVVVVQESKLGGEDETYLFGSVLDRFLDMFSNINSVHQLILQGVERNVRYQWDVRTGLNRTL